MFERVNERCAKRNVICAVPILVQISFEKFFDNLLLYSSLNDVVVICVFHIVVAIEEADGRPQKSEIRPSLNIIFTMSFQKKSKKLQHRDF